MSEFFYLWLLIFSGLLPLALTIYLRRWESTIRVKLLSGIMLCASFWSFAYIGQLLSVWPSGIFWFKAKYIAIAIIPVFWLNFALEYTGRKECVNKKYFMAMLIVPLINILLIYTNGYHSAFFERFISAEVGPFFTQRSIIGLGFWVHSIYSYILLFLGAIIVLWAMVKARSLYLKQAFILAVGILTPLVVNVLYISSTSSFGNFDPTPLAFIVTIVAFTWNIARYGFLELVPMTHEQAFDNIGDAMLILDRENRVLDINEIAKDLIIENFHPPEDEEFVGKKADEFFKYSDEIMDLMEEENRTRGSIEIESKGEMKYFDILKSQIRDDRDRLIGRVFIFRNITELAELKENRFLHILLRQDLRSKLQLIAGHIQLSERRVPKEYKSNLLEALEKTEESLDLIHQVKRLREIRDKGLRGSHEIDKAIDSVIDDMDKFFESGDIDLEIVRPIKSIMVIGGYPLKVLLINILKSRIYNFNSNKIRISTEELEESFRITIEDDGEEFSEALEKILRDKSYTGETTGMGGLRIQIIKRISQELNGKIELDQSDLGGVKFDIILQKAGLPSSEDKKE